MTATNTGLTEASHLFQQRKYNEARKVLQRLERSGFESPEMHLMLGFCERQRRRSFDALRHFELAAKAAPSDYRPPFQIACAWDELGDHAQAEQWYRQSLSLEPYNHRAHSNLGNALQDMGRKKEAIESYQHALELSPSLSVTCYNLATALFDHDNPGPAVEMLERALTLEPGMVRAHFDLGTLYWLQGENLRAEKCMEKVCAAGLDHLVSSLDYVKANATSETRLFGDAFDVFQYALAHAPDGGAVAEFGVSFGNSIRFIASLTDRRVYGFDSFEGLPVAWSKEPKGMYTTRGKLPEVPGNVEFRVGWFKDTLPSFAMQFSEPLIFANVDCDLYSSTREVLETLGHLFPAGGVICFDEYIGHETWQHDEYRAFQEYVARTGRSYRYLGFSFMSKQAVVVLDN
jgi:tetratricopeptide (TPR) repeat protein